MKFSENWLRTFVNPPLSTSDLAHALTMAGLEVEAIEPVAPAFHQGGGGRSAVSENIRMRITSTFVTVNVGSAANSEPLQIVCGAANVRAGIKVPCALAGARTCLVLSLNRRRYVELNPPACYVQPKNWAWRKTAAGLLLLPDNAPTGADFRRLLRTRG